MAQRGETPGWDITYTSVSGSQISVEVKATTSARFSALEITGNEWRAAELQGENYVLAMVSRAMSGEPHIALLRNPVKLARIGTLILEPTSYRLTSRSEA